MIQSDIELQKRSIKKIEETLILAKGNYPGPLLGISEIRVTFDVQGGAAGRAFYDQRRIGLNMAFLRSETENMLSETIPHEVAHIVAYILDRKQGRGHSYLWKEVARKLGSSAKRCHDYDVSVVREVFHYNCSSCTHLFKLSKRAHNNQVRSGGTYYKCRRCKAQLIKV